MEKEMTLQDLVRRNGALQKEMVDAYVLQIESELNRMHQERHICHLDVRPAMVMVSTDGKATLYSSSMVQAYSEEGADTDFRDLQAVRQYLLTGKKVEFPDESPVEESIAPVPMPEAKKTNIFNYLIGLVGLVMIGSLFWYFFSNRVVNSKSHNPVMAKTSFADYYYEGETVDGKPHGKGIAKYNDGRVYQGRFHQGKREDKQARFIYADGKVFVGCFAADTIRKGRVDLVTKDYYFVGDFVQGKPYSGYWYSTSDNKKVERVVKGEEILL